MGKAKRRLEQLGFDFEALTTPEGEAAMAGFEARTNVLVGEMLNSDGRDRYQLAAEVSKLLGEDISKAMLDAYSSPAREDHRVPHSRLAAIIAVTGRYDLFDHHCRQFGCAVVTGRAMDTVELGHLEQEKRQIEARMRELRKRPSSLGKSAD